MVPGAKEWERYLVDFAQPASNGNTPAPPWMRELRRTALDTACMEDGAFVSVPAGTAVPKPMHLLFVTTAPEKSTVSHPRNLILMGGGSRAMIVESYVGLGPASYFTNAVTEIVIGENAVLTHDKLVEETDVAFHIATTQAQLDRSAVFPSRA